MSAQGGTLARRGTVHLPVWPIAAALSAAVATAIAMSVLGGTAVQERFVTSVPRTEQLANSSAAIREQGGTMPAPTTNPGMWTQAQAEAYVDGLVTAPVGLENPGAYVDQTIAYATGLENPAAYPVIKGGPYTAPAEPHQLIEVNGKPCGQCR